MLLPRLRELRETKKLKQDDIAKRINKSAQAYSLYELGKRSPDLETLILLSQFYDVTIDYLLGVSDRKHPISPATPLLKLYEKDFSNLPDTHVSMIINYIEMVQKIAYADFEAMHALGKK